MAKFYILTYFFFKARHHLALSKYIDFPCLSLAGLQTFLSGAVTVKLCSNNGNAPVCIEH